MPSVFGKGPVFLHLTGCKTTNQILKPNYPNQILKLTQTGTSQFYYQWPIISTQILQILYMNCMSIAPLPAQLIWVASREKYLYIYNIYIHTYTGFVRFSQVFSIGMQKFMILSQTCKFTYLGFVSNPLLPLLKNHRVRLLKKL